MEFGEYFDNIKGDKFTLLWIIAGFVLVLLFKNSMQKRDTFDVSYRNLLFNVFILIVSLFHFSSFSEFLYFNF